MAETEQRWGSLTYVDLDAYRLSDGRVMVNRAEPGHRIPEEFVPADQLAGAVAETERLREALVEIAHSPLPLDAEAARLLARKTLAHLLPRKDEMSESQQFTHGTAAGRMKATWKRMHDDEAEVGRLTGYSPVSSKYPLEFAYVDAFRALRVERDEYRMAAEAEAEEVDRLNKQLKGAVEEIERLKVDQQTYADTYARNMERLRAENESLRQLEGQSP